MKYEHLKRDRVLHNDETEITSNPKYVVVVLHNMGLTNCKPSPTPSVTVSVKRKADDDVDLDMQKEQREAAVPIIFGLGQSDGGVLDALWNPVRAIRETK